MGFSDHLQVQINKVAKESIDKLQDLRNELVNMQDSKVHSCQQRILGEVNIMLQSRSDS
jgi:hypothetical protein